MPVSQFTQALLAYLGENTANFNKKYSVSATSPPPSRPSSPISIRNNSQYELAKRAINTGSPKNFNAKYAIGKGRRSRRTTRKHRKQRRSTRKN
jgi:hypothetical protein